MEKPGGRPRDEVWQHVKRLEGGRRVKCNYCGYEFAASANRIKSHINGDKGKGIRVCPDFPQSHNFGSANKGTSNHLKDGFLHSQGFSLDGIIDHRKSNEAGQIQGDAKCEERIQVGSSFVSNWENEDVQMMKRYVFECLRSEDKVFISPLSYLTQREFITLKPEAHLDSLVIDIFVEMLTDIERKKKMVPSNWYLPVTFSEKAVDAAVKGEVVEFLKFVHCQKMKENYMSDLNYCEKIFVPVYVGPRPNGGHFYLYSIHLKNKEIEIWDSLCNTSYVVEIADTTEKLFLAMEKLFEKVTFTEFRLKAAYNILLQPNGFDCGVFVINYMQQSDNYVKRDSSFQFDSQKEREDLALKLLNNDLNQEKQNLYDKARRHYAQVEKQDGNKRLRDDPSKEHFEYDDDSDEDEDDLENVMAENMRMKEMQADIKKTQDFVGYAKERFGQLDQLSSVLQSLVTSVDAIRQRLDQSSSNSSGSSQVLPMFPGAQPLRSVKLDFPRFDGSDALLWLFKAEQYFKYYDISDAQKIILASAHFDGDVLPWFQMLDKAGRIPSWLALSRAIEVQYGPSMFDCARAQLFKLTQSALGGSLEDYNAKFLSLANRTDELSETALLNCYLGGLTANLQRDVMVQRPSTVPNAMALARLFSGSSVISGFSPSKLDTSKFLSPPSSTISTAIISYTSSCSMMSSTSISSTKPPLPPLLPTPSMRSIKRMTPSDMLIRREKGLCYTCDAKFTPSHRCPNKQLMLLQGEEDDDPDPLIPPSIEPESEATIHHLSVHALRGTHGAATIRFQGSIYGITVQILLDGGSSDNFVHPRIVHHLGLAIEPASPIQVLGGTGRILSSNEQVVNIPVQICGHSILLTMYVMPVVGVDLVIGAGWLETLGPHIADYSNSSIKFLVDNNYITLTGYKGSMPFEAQLYHFV